MNRHEQLLNNLFRSLNDHDHLGLAACYHKDALFRDIAFNLSGRDRIHAMWEMICTDNELGPSDIKVTVQSLSADDRVGQARILDNYTYRESKRKVLNAISSTFVFRDGHISKHEDDCDAVDWASQAMAAAAGMGQRVVVRP